MNKKPYTNPNFIFGFFRNFFFDGFDLQIEKFFGRHFLTFFTIFSPFFPLSDPLFDSFDRQIVKFLDDFFEFLALFGTF